MHEQAYAVSVVDLATKYQTASPLNKVLNTVTSVNIREDGGLGSNYSFSMNGFSGNQVKFFIDGIPMDNFGSSFNLATISANMADRIEVYKGVLPVSLGSDALGGAVNIVSRTNANYLDATYSVGSFNTHRAAVNGVYTSKAGFTFRANAFANYSDNDYEVWAPIVNLQTNKQEGEEWAKRFNDGYQSYGVKLETGVVRQSWADYLLVGMIASADKRNVQTGATMDAVYGGVKNRSWSFIPSIRYKKNDLLVPGLSLSLYGTYSMVNTYNVDTLARRYNWRGEWVNSTSAGEAYLTDATIRERQWQANANVSYVISDHHSLTLNDVFSAIRRKSNDAMYPDDEMNDVPQQLTKNITGLGYQVRYDRWNANVFGKMYRLYSSTNKLMDQFTENQRWEKLTDRKQRYGYGAAATYYILPSLQAKVSFERAYRMPEAVEMFGDGLVQKANPDLKPESSNNLNAGLLFDQTLGDHRLQAEVNYIYRDTKDFILKGVSLSSNPTTSYDNLGKVQTRGVEASLGYAYKQVFHVNGNLTYQDIKDKMRYQQSENTFVGDGISENITYGQRLPNIPYLFMNGHADYQFVDLGAKGNTLSLNYDVNYVHDYYLSFSGLGAKATKKVIPEQLSHNVSLGYSLCDGRYSIVAECQNLTNAKLYDNYRLQKPGRSFNVKFRLYLSK
jgi:outer membrane receptor protein involved in Fe transport